MSAKAPHLTRDVVKNLNTSKPKPPLPQTGSLVRFVIVAIVAICLGLFFISNNNNTSNIDDQLYPQLNNSKIPSEWYQTFRNDTTVITSELYPAEITQYKTLGVLPREKWSPDRSVQDGILETNFPRLLTNTFVQNWDAFKTWDLQSASFRERLAKVITGVYIGETPYYGPLFRKNRPLLKANPNIEWHNPFRIEPRVANDLFDRVAQSAKRRNGLSSENFVYYTGGLNTPGLSADIIPHSELLPYNQTQLINVWVGEKGVVTHLHVDSYENYFVQVVGQKKFVLFPPQHSDNFYLYPFQHPSRGQSQIFPINAPQSAINNFYQEQQIFQNVTKLEAYEVIVNPGDVLYLPPYWGHQVYTLEPSISINFWCQSKMQANYNAAMEQVTKNIIHEWSHQQRLIASYYITNFLIHDPTVRLGMKVFDNIVDDYNPYNLTTQFQQRYQTMFAYNTTTGLPLNDTKKFYYSLLTNSRPLNVRALKRNKLLNHIGNNDYFANFFNRYVHSRYNPGIQQGEYGNNTIDLTNLTQDEIRIACNTTQFSLQIPNWTAQEYFKAYQGGGLMMKTPFFESSHTDLDNDIIPTDAYLEVLHMLSQNAAFEFAQIPPQQRPILLTDFIESLAYWASPANGTSIVKNIQCISALRPVY